MKALRTKAKAKAKSSATKSIRDVRERAVWTSMHGFVNARPEGYKRECADGCSLTVPQATLLRMMQPDKPIPMSGLATALACHASNVTGLVDRLEEAGLVVRQASAEDRRVKNIELTPKGEEVREMLYSEIFAPPPELARLTDEELTQLESLLRRIEVIPN